MDDIDPKFGFFSLSLKFCFNFLNFLADYIRSHQEMVAKINENKKTLIKRTKCHHRAPVGHHSAVRRKF